METPLTEIVASTLTEPVLCPAPPVETAVNRVFLSSLADGYRSAFLGGLEFLGHAARIRPGDRVAVKPNLTFPRYRAGVMTSPDAVRAMVDILLERGARVTVCESDSGGYNPFSMDQVFAETGLHDLWRRDGVEVVNLSRMPAHNITVRAGWRRLTVPLPRKILDETDRFITMPVPKIHVNTGISVSIKNQWGLIQNPAIRLKLHPYFNEVIYAITRALPPALAVVDGRYGLTRSGPMSGDPVPLNWTLLTNSLYTCDYVVARLMGIDPGSIGHLRHIFGREGFNRVSTAEYNADPGRFRTGNFYLRRRITDYPGLMTFHSRPLAWLGYESPLARPLHWLLYRIREPFY